MKMIRWSLGALLVASTTVAVSGCDKKSPEQRGVLPGSAERGPATEGVNDRDDREATTSNGRSAADDVTANDQGRPNADPMTPAAAASNRAAVDSIAAARCEREQRCNNIGDGKKYESRGSCVTNVRSDWKGELSSLECPNGIERDKLDACLERLRSDGCANPVESLGRLAVCRQAELCRAG